MSLETIIEKSKRLESLLKRMGYRGKGLHELVSQAQPALDANVLRACRKVATIRNKAVHEEGYRLHGRALQDFYDTADYAAERLSALLAPEPIRRTNKSDGQLRAGPSATARPVRARPVFGKRIPDPAANKARPGVRHYLIVAGLAVGAAGIWLLEQGRH